MSSQKPVGKTESQGWQIGVRRTMPVSETEAWQMIMSALGLLWPEDPGEIQYKKGAALETDDGTQIEVRSYEHGSLIRMKWQPKDWDFKSTLQIRVLPAKTGTTISIHHEWLQNAEQREMMRVRWTTLLERLKAEMSS